MKIAIVGGGAAGLFCAANLPSNEVTIFESTSSCGNKLLLTGGGRCNYTNISQNFSDGIIKGDKFLQSSLSNFNSENLIEWFKIHGLDTHIEGKRAFPLTQSSKSVLELLQKVCRRNNVKIRYNSFVDNIEPQKFGGYKIFDKQFDAVVVATGGKTFPKTGSDGNGNKLLNLLGVKTRPFTPKLGALYVKNTEMLQGVSMEIKLTLKSNEKITATETGPVVFTHFGISGPAALDCSGMASECDTVEIDFLPNKTSDAIKQELILARSESKNQLLHNHLSAWLPRRVAKFIEQESGAEKISEMSNKLIEAVVNKIKKCVFDFLHFSSFNQCWVSDGGADLSQINPKNMEIKSHPNLFVIGEQLDVFGLCGGYNLQIAFSTAKAVADYLEGVKK